MHIKSLYTTALLRRYYVVYFIYLGYVHIGAYKCKCYVMYADFKIPLVRCAGKTFHRICPRFPSSLCQTFEYVTQSSPHSFRVTFAHSRTEKIPDSSMQSTCRKFSTTGGGKHCRGIPEPCLTLSNLN
jgi:hypothetical protein